MSIEFLGKSKTVRKPDFRQFYELHFQNVYRFVFFRVYQNRDVAEDLTSEIFMRALKAFETYDPAKSEKAWIMTIARNHLINYYRDKKETSDLDEIAFQVQGIDGNELEDTNDTIREIQSGLLELEENDRELIELKYIQGYRYKEIANIVGKTPGAVRVETFRAMKKLKLIIKPRYEEVEKTTSAVA
ncbi:hypothetical protein CO173_03640 [Candidatus Uhrbacteria bacterium CG_4_9_14_3_um_filter_41_35]|uniref:RNA polymerase sigma factor n=1 Tax=Candidatus Uhrbacteria bacterium CG_4_9_14_3_um_filter_41_35 TaxID=1975034 RepID=A0A2M7XEG7_9BACT|nr:MAG: hypothetical protein CO173_03640 [Candidatus Uhrbacteria bacterium CG_4_9_14_3_um_filter_41_35]